MHQSHLECAEHHAKSSTSSGQNKYFLDDPLSTKYSLKEVESS